MCGMLSIAKMSLYVRHVIAELRSILSEEVYVTPDQYRHAVGKCPPSWNLAGTHCVQVRSGPTRFALGDAEPEAATKLKQAVAKGAVTPSKEPRVGTMDAIAHEEAVPPPKDSEILRIDPTRDDDGDGITDGARVGLCGRCTAPPKSIPRLPNLTADEREAESRFADAFEADPDGIVEAYRTKLKNHEIGDAPNVFATDDAKLLSPDYNPEDKGDAAVKEGRARYNAATHQTANAIVKRAFLQQLDELEKLPKDDPKRAVLVTSGGVGSGKGFAIGNVKEASEIAKSVGAVWDAAGEQNATENPWVQDELKKRGLRGIYLFVDSDPSETWENPKRGVVERAAKVGRMVDARLFADSYALGAKNFKAFQDKHKDEAEFIVISSRKQPPERVEGTSKEALVLNADAIYARTSKVIDEREDLPPAVRRGASIGRRIWGSPQSQS